MYTNQLQNWRSGATPFDTSTQPRLLLRAQLRTTVPCRICAQIRGVAKCNNNYLSHERRSSMHHLRMIINSPACSRGGGFKLIVDLFQSQIRMHARESAAQNDCAALRVQLKRIFFFAFALPVSCIVLLIGWWQRITLPGNHAITRHTHSTQRVHAFARADVGANAKRLSTNQPSRRSPRIRHFSHMLVYVYLSVCSVSYMLPP